MKDTQGEPFSEETRSYDRYGRLVEIVQDGKSVKYEYDKSNRLERQVIDGKTIMFGYTKYGRLQSKTLLSEKGKVTELKYWYGTDGKITARLANGQMQKYAYDLKGQLVAVTDADGKDVERYVYDPAGNILEKTVGGKKTTYTYDAANQLVSSTDADGKVTAYAYDAAGRLVKEGAKTYRYGYLDKVLAVTEGNVRYTYGYHVDGQLATATKRIVAKPKKARRRKKGEQAPEQAPPAPETEEFYWDGLALVKRGGTSYMNEPHPGGGAAVLSSKDGVMFNDILGTTLGVEGEGGYTATPLTAFGDAAESQPSTLNPQPLFTGKPLVDGLGHAFLMRNYRAGLGKWLSADPLGYPDGWNQMAYCNNGVCDAVDFHGGWVESVHHDINFQWLTQNGYIPVDDYQWGISTISVLTLMNNASDWTDSWANQDDEHAYMHAMRSSRDQSFQDAVASYYNYLVMCRQNAMYYSKCARSAYAAYNDAAAYSLEATAIFYLGCLVHTFVDDLSPSHSGFQYFSLWDSPQHLWNERYAVYENGYRTSILEDLDAQYLGLLRYVLRQPYRE